MPYFTTVEGEFTQLCVYAAQDQACPNPKCKHSHEPKERRVCPLFHNPAERCPHNPCLLGHHEARGAFRASKALKACKRLSEHATQEEEANEHEAADLGTNGGGKPEIAQTPILKPAPIKTVTDPNANQQKNANTVVAGAQPVDFQKMAEQQVQQAGQQDEMKRLYQITEQLQSQFEALKKETTDKDKEVRALQTAMGDISAENASLREENESKSPVLDAYYKDVFESRSNTRMLVDLNVRPPSEAALEGSLTVLNMMFAKPLEFSTECKIVDLFQGKASIKILK
jgi:hypothetical protein